MPDAYQIAPLVTGFEFLRDETGTQCWLKTKAGDLRGAYTAAEALHGALVFLDRGGNAEPLRDAVISLADELAESGIATFRPLLREPEHPLECIHDALAAVVFLTDFGVDRLLIAGTGIAGGAALAAGFAIPEMRAVTVLDPVGLPEKRAGRSDPDVTLWFSADEDPSVTAFVGPEKVGRSRTHATIDHIRSDLRARALQWLALESPH